MTAALRDVIRQGTGRAAALGRPGAGKTGTTEDHRDAWFCGYVPQLAACVWIGYPHAQIPLRNVHAAVERRAADACLGWEANGDVVRASAHRGGAPRPAAGSRLAGSS